MIDLGADRIITAEKQEEKIAIEVKSFIANSLLQAFHEAIGQYRNYDSVLSKEEPDRILYLAVSEKVFEMFMETPFFKDRLEEEDINLIVLNTKENTIVGWIN